MDHLMIYKAVQVLGGQEGRQGPRWINRFLTRGMCFYHASPAAEFYSGGFTFFCSFFIGPRSDHSLAMSVTNSLTDSLSHDLVED